MVDGIMFRVGRLLYILISSLLCCATFTANPSPASLSAEDV